MSITLKLIKGLSYRGGVNGILKATKVKPFCTVETMEEAKAAVATGHFEIVTAAAPTEDMNQKKPSSAVTTADLPKALNKMTTNELIAKATELNVDISQCNTNKERVGAIQKALDEGAQNTINQQDENIPPQQEDSANQQDDGETPKIPFQEE